MGRHGDLSPLLLQATHRGATQPKTNEKMTLVMLDTLNIPTRFTAFQAQAVAISLLPNHWRGSSVPEPPASALPCCNPASRPLCLLGLLPGLKSKPWVSSPSPDPRSFVHPISQSQLLIPFPCSQYLILWPNPQKALRPCTWQSRNTAPPPLPTSCMQRKWTTPGLQAILLLPHLPSSGSQSEAPF